MNPQSITPAGPNALSLETLATRLSSSEMRAVQAAAEADEITLCHISMSLIQHLIVRSNRQSSPRLWAFAYWFLICFQQPLQD
jgi:hypothetical protein